MIKQYPIKYEKIIQDIRYENNQSQVTFHMPKAAQSIAIGFCNDLTLQYPISTKSVPSTVKFIETVMALNISVFGKLKHVIDPQSNLDIESNVAVFKMCSSFLINKLEALQKFLNLIMDKLSQGNTDISSTANSIVYLLNPIIAFANSIDIVSDQIYSLAEIQPLSPDFVNIASATSEIIESLNAIYKNNTDSYFVEVQQQKLSTHYSYVTESVNQYISYLKAITQAISEQFQDIKVKPSFNKLLQFYKSQIQSFTQMSLICIDIIRNDFDNYERTLQYLTKAAEQMIRELPFIFMIFYEKHDANKIKPLFDDYEYTYSDLISPFISQIIESSETLPSDFTAHFITMLQESLKIYDENLKDFPRIFEEMLAADPHNAISGIQPSQFLSDYKKKFVLPVLEPAFKLAHALIDSDADFKSIYDMAVPVFEQQPVFQGDIEEVIPDETDDGIILLMGARDSVLSAFNAITESIRDYSVSQTDEAMRAKLASNVCLLIVSVLGTSTDPSLFEYSIEVLLLCTKWIRKYLSSDLGEYSKAASTSRTLIFDSNDAVDAIPKIAQLMNMIQLATNDQANKMSDTLENAPTLVCIGAVLSAMMDSYDYTIQKATSDSLVKPLIDKAIENAFPLHNFVVVCRQIIWLLLHTEAVTASKIMSTFAGLPFSNVEIFTQNQERIDKALESYVTSRSTSNLSPTILLEVLKLYVKDSEKITQTIEENSKGFADFERNHIKRLKFVIELNEKSQSITPIPHKHVTGILLYGLASLAKAEIKEMDNMLDQLPDRALLQSIGLSYYVNDIYALLMTDEENKGRAEGIEKDRRQIVRISADAACGDYSIVDDIKAKLVSLEAKLDFENEIEDGLKACIKTGYLNAVGIDFVEVSSQFKEEQKNLDLEVNHAATGNENKKEIESNEDDIENYGFEENENDEEKKEVVPLGVVKVLGDQLVFPPYKHTNVNFGAQRDDKNKQHYEDYINEEPNHDISYRMIEFTQPEPLTHTIPPPWPPEREPDPNDDGEEREIEVDVEIIPFEEEEDRGNEIDEKFIDKYVRPRLERRDSFDSLNFNSNDSLSSSDALSGVLHKVKIDVNPSMFSMPDDSPLAFSQSDATLDQLVMSTPINKSNSPRIKFEENLTPPPKSPSMPEIPKTYSETPEAQPITTEKKSELPPPMNASVEKQINKHEAPQPAAPPTIPQKPVEKESELPPPMFIPPQAQQSQPQQPPMPADKKSELPPPIIPEKPSIPPMPSMPPIPTDKKSELPPPISASKPSMPPMPSMPPIPTDKKSELPPPISASKPSMPPMPAMPPMSAIPIAPTGGKPDAPPANMPTMSPMPSTPDKKSELPPPIQSPLMPAMPPMPATPPMPTDRKADTPPANMPAMSPMPSTPDKKPEMPSPITSPLMPAMPPMPTMPAMPPSAQKQQPPPIPTNPSPPASETPLPMPPIPSGQEKKSELPPIPSMPKQEEKAPPPPMFPPKEAAPVLPMPSMPTMPQIPAVSNKSDLPPPIPGMPSMPSRPAPVQRQEPMPMPPIPQTGEKKTDLPPPMPSMQPIPQTQMAMPAIPPIPSPMPTMPTMPPIPGVQDRSQSSSPYSSGSRPSMPPLHAMQERSSPAASPYSSAHEFRTEEPQIPPMPPMQQVTTMPAMPPIPEPKKPALPSMPPLPEAPKTVMPSMSSLQEPSKVGFPETRRPSMPAFPSMQQPQKASQPALQEQKKPVMPTMPQMPVIPEMPQIPEVAVPPNPALPSAAKRPSMPSFPTMPQMQEVKKPEPAPAQEMRRPSVPVFAPVETPKTTAAPPEERRPSVPVFAPVEIPKSPPKQQPQQPSAPQLPVIPGMPTIPKMQQKTPDRPNFEDFDNKPKMPTMPQMPAFQTTLSGQKKPVSSGSTGGMPPMPAMPPMPSMPQMPQIPPATTMPGQKKQFTTIGNMPPMPQMPPIQTGLPRSNSLMPSMPPMPQMPRLPNIAPPKPTMPQLPNVQQQTPPKQKDKKDDSEYEYYYSDDEDEVTDPKKKAIINQVSNVRTHISSLEKLLAAYNPANPNAVIKMMKEAVAMLENETMKLESQY